MRKRTSWEITGELIEKMVNEGYYVCLESPMFNEASPSVVDEQWRCSVDDKTGYRMHFADSEDLHEAVGIVAKEVGIE